MNGEGGRAKGATVGEKEERDPHPDAYSCAAGAGGERRRVNGERSKNEKMEKRRTTHEA